MKRTITAKIEMAPTANISLCQAIAVTISIIFGWNKSACSGKLNPSEDELLQRVDPASSTFCSSGCAGCEVEKSDAKSPPFRHRVPFPDFMSSKRVASTFIRDAEYSFVNMKLQETKKISRMIVLTTALGAFNLAWPFRGKG